MDITFFCKLTLSYTTDMPILLIIWAMVSSSHRSAPKRYSLVVFNPNRGNSIG